MAILRKESGELVGRAYTEDAARLAHCWNCHDELVGALKRLVTMHGDSVFICGVDDQSAVDNVLRQALAALDKATNKE